MSFLPRGHAAYGVRHHSTTLHTTLPSNRNDPLCLVFLFARCQFSTRATQGLTATSRAPTGLAWPRGKYMCCSVVATASAPLRGPPFDPACRPPGAPRVGLFRLGTSASAESRVARIRPQPPPVAFCFFLAAVSSCAGEVNGELCVAEDLKMQVKPVIVRGSGDDTVGRPSSSGGPRPPPSLFFVVPVFA